MIDPLIIDVNLGLLFVLGMRHGIDPDHIAVIDNLTFLAADERPRLAPWTGTLFALGHSLSVAGVAALVAVLANELTLPGWLAEAVDWLIISLLLLVGSLNLNALLKKGRYQPIGWRSRLMPKSLRSTCHPVAIVLIGMGFGLVFDTATQAAAWGTAATSGGGPLASLSIIGFFAAGMMLTDTFDSQVVTRLLRADRHPDAVQYYRTAIGWLIVALSFGMAGYALAERLGAEVEMDETTFTLVGAVMMSAVILTLLSVRLMRRVRLSEEA